MIETFNAGDFFIGIGILILLVTISLILANRHGRRKSQDYRKQITDMYVAAKTRVLAKEDNLDLVEEDRNFKIWSKKIKATENNYDLDNVIEEELIEKISEPKKK